MNQQETFNSWIKDYRALLFKVVRAYTLNNDDANDLFQEMAIQAWKSIPNFRGEAAVSTWLYRIALNTAIRWSKKEKKHSYGKQDIDKSAHLLEYKPDHQDERLDWLYYQIAQMNEIDKSLALLLLDGYSYKEMAEMVGISESNVGVKIYRIKNHLVERSKTYENHGV
ncbi:MAG: RNA polymerase sigma factor [Fulvivirga sp.]|uniref:RNA polymerase sigma factor n=1 Tax=Fulvivirga sp. TaxID=1931237 RepID=UPI0032EE649F